MTTGRSFFAFLACCLASAVAHAQPETHACAALAQRLAQSPAVLEGRLLHEALFEAAALDCGDIAVSVISGGASAEARNRSGKTALSISAERGARNVARILIEAGADVNHRDLAGSTPLLGATGAGRRRMVTMLIEAGADPNAANKQGITPLMAAAFEGDARTVRLLLEAGAEVGRRDSHGKGAIIYAAARAYPGIVKQLIEAGVDADGVWGNELTPLMWAAGHANDAPSADAIKVAEILLDAGAEISRRDNRGRDALMIAAERGHAGMVAFLLARGADAKLRDLAGLSAADITRDAAIRDLLTD